MTLDYLEEQLALIDAALQQTEQQIESISAGNERDIPAGMWLYRDQLQDRRERLGDNRERVQAAIAEIERRQPKHENI
jgi:prefoldin subunit 5